MTAINLADRLREIDVFADLPQADLEWLASKMTVQTYKPNEVISHEGEPAENMTVILEGRIRGQKENSTDNGRTYTAMAGQITGMLPYSRLTHFPLTTRAVGPTTLALLPVSAFPEMMQRLPTLESRLVRVMADRIRETAVADQQRAKLAALGKLAAGLAHELNNPASAASRSAKALREAMQDLRAASLRLDKRQLTTEQRVFLAETDCGLNEPTEPVALDSLERSDREEQVGAWLESKNIDNPWVLASALVDAGLEMEMLEDLAQRFPPDVLRDVVVRMTASFTTTRLLSEIEHSVQRISELVTAVKEYSYMDRMAEQEIDVHGGIESTLVMLKHRLRNGVNVVREYDRTLPKICAHGSELNQVWTNLIENAVDAMEGKGELRIRTSSQNTSIVVEVADTGPGIPPAIRDRIFEPFFTTKGVGHGTGLGLDVVYRVVQKHGGDVTVESKPGDTRIQVRLPIPTAKEGVLCG